MQLIFSTILCSFKCRLKSLYLFSYLLEYNNLHLFLSALYVGTSHYYMVTSCEINCQATTGRISNKDLQPYNFPLQVLH